MFQKDNRLSVQEAKIPDPKKLLIVRTDRIGDVVLSLPLAGIIKKHYPGSKITFLVRSYTKELAENNPDIDEIIILKEKADNNIPLWVNVSAIKKKKFDVSIIVYPTFITALIIFFSRIKIRIGSGYRWYSALFNRKVYVHRKYGEKHELEFNIDLLKEIGIDAKVDQSVIKFGLSVDEKSKQEVGEVFQENNISKNKPIIIIHPGSGGSAVDLPVSKFKELINLIVNNLDAQIILTGSSKEFELCEQLNISEKIYNFAGRFNLSGLIALINESDIFVANSTGPIHIAAALDKYTIGFYPNIKACSSRRWGPYSDKAHVFSPQLDCDDCKREQCESSQCMSAVNMLDVYKKLEDIRKLLNYGALNG